MQDFQGKVAVITGGSNGIGYSLAERCVKEGMKVVIASPNLESLSRAESQLKALDSQAQILSVKTDVSKAAEVEELARRTVEVFGKVHLLVNNAGVVVFENLWESTLADWEWELGVNLMGVVHGIHTFVPIMLAQDTECYIVNTSSMAGLVSWAGFSSYGVTKHAVVGLSEILQAQLVQVEAKIKVAVLCPGFVKTEINDSERNRPFALRNESGTYPVSEAQHQAILQGMEASEVADKVFKAIEQNKFYILTHPQFKRFIQLRMENILEERDPTFTPATAE